MQRAAVMRIAAGMNGRREAICGDLRQQRRRELAPGTYCCHRRTVTTCDTEEPLATRGIHMSLRRFVGVFFGIVGAALLAAVLYIAFGDLSRHKSRIAALVTQSTGRPFAIDGPFKLKVIPVVDFSAERIRLGNVQGGSQPQMVEIGRVSTHIGMPSTARRKAWRRKLSAVAVDSPSVRSQTRPASSLRGWGTRRPDTARSTRARRGGTGSESGRCVHAKRPSMRCVPAGRRRAGALSRSMTTAGRPSRRTS